MYRSRSGSSRLPARRARALRRFGPAIAVGLGIAAAAPVAGAAELYEPADGRILSGAAVEYPASTHVPQFLNLTNQPDLAIVHGYVGHLKSMSSVLKQFNGIDSAVMLSWRAMAANAGSSGGNLTKVANGQIDSYIVSSAKAVDDFPRPVFIRLYWEFTGTWFPWSTYTSSGAKRTGNSPEMYRKAWQRIRIIFDGGTKSQINNRLSAVGLPALKVSNSSLPAVKAAFVWSVSKGGVKPKDKPHKTADYWPGNAYVDWVGQGLHQYGSKPFSHWASGVNSPDPIATVNAVYDFAVSKGKPMMMSEWAIATKPYGNGDDQNYMDDALSWIDSHPKAKAQVYFDRIMDGYTHQLKNFPKARAVFSQHVNHNRYLHDWRQISSAGSVGTGGGGGTTEPPTSGGGSGDGTCDYEDRWHKISLPSSGSQTYADATLNFCDPYREVIVKPRANQSSVWGKVVTNQNLIIKVGGAKVATQSKQSYGYWFKTPRPSGSSTVIAIKES
jgi:hypothetical protein